MSIFYPSVSSVAQNKLSAMEHIEMLFALGHPHFLISAYDFANLFSEEKKRLNNKVVENDTDLLLDSGI